MNLEEQIAAPAGMTPRPEGVRILAPTGELGYIPADQVDAAVADGAVVMTPEKMRELRQDVFMQHMLFKDQNQSPRKRRRRSIVKGGRR